MNQLAALVKNHDHFYHYSDCSASYQKGREQRAEIERVAQTATETEKAEARGVWTELCGEDLPCPF